MLLIVDQNMSKKWHIFAHLWEFAISSNSLFSLDKWPSRSTEQKPWYTLTNVLHDTPKDWAFQVHLCAYAHNSQPFSELNISPHEIVFHTRPRIPLTFDLNLTRDTSKTCISRYCSQLPEHSHYEKTNLKPFFYKTLSKPIPQWFLAVETAMLQIYSTVNENTLQKNQLPRLHYQNIP